MCVFHSDHYRIPQIEMKVKMILFDDSLFNYILIEIQSRNMQLATMQKPTKAEYLY